MEWKGKRGSLWCKTDSLHTSGSQLSTTHTNRHTRLPEHLPSWSSQHSSRETLRLSGVAPLLNTTSRPDTHCGSLKHTHNGLIPITAGLKQYLIIHWSEIIVCTYWEVLMQKLKTSWCHVPKHRIGVKAHTNSELRWKQPFFFKSLWETANKKNHYRTRTHARTHGCFPNYSIFPTSGSHQCSSVQSEECVDWCVYVCVHVRVCVSELSGGRRVGGCQTD